jgi:hypothetical protein
MRRRVTIRGAVEADVPQLQALHGEDFGGSFYHEGLNYRPEQTVFCVAEIGNRIVGTQALLPYELVVNGKRMLTGRSERTMVLPVSEGILSDLMEECVNIGRERGMQFFWGSSTTPSAIRSFNRVGYFHLTGHREHWSAVSSTQVLSQYAKYIARSRLLAGSKDLSAMRHSNDSALVRYFQIASSCPSLIAKGFGNISSVSTKRTIHISETEESGEGIDSFLERIRSKVCQIYVSHERSFLEWTIHSGSNDGKWLFAYEGSILMGYVCVSFNSKHSASVIDFAATDSDVILKLLKEVLAMASKSKKPFVTIVCNPQNTLQRRIFRGLWKAGFVRSFRSGGTSVIRPGEYKDLTVLYKPNSWYMTDLWSLLYRSSSQVLA